MKTIKWKRLSIGLLCILIITAITACGNKNPDKDPTSEATTAPIATATSERKPTTATDSAVEGPAAPVPADFGEVDRTPPETLATCDLQPLPILPVSPETDDDWAIGASAEDAKYIIFEYSDFQCPGCSGMAPVIKLFAQDNPNVRLIYRHFPLGFHELAPLAAQAAEAAGAQGKFWEMHDILFTNQAGWGAGEEEAAQAKLTEYAKELGLDMKQFEHALDNGTYAAKVQAQYDEAANLELPGTPAFIFNGVLFPSDMGLSYQGLAAFMDIMESQETLFFDAPPEMTLDMNAEYQATLKTNKGDVLIELWPETAPAHVNNFVFLADEDWYNGAPFFFVQDHFVAVTGDPSGTTVGYPGYACVGEERTFQGQTGLVWMMGNGQFFITLGADAYANLVAAAESQGYPPAEFALVGQVIAGQDVLDTIQRVSPQQPDAPTDVLESVTITKN